MSAKTKTKKKASPAQLRARKLFAERAKSGALNRMRTTKSASRKRNALKFKSESEFQDWQKKAQKKGGSVFQQFKKAKPKTRVRKFRKPAKRALARAFSGSGMLGLGRSSKTIRANKKRSSTRQSKTLYKRGFPKKLIGVQVRRRGSRSAMRASGYAKNPHGEHLPGLPQKYQRMYERVLASVVAGGRNKGREKEVAARTVWAEVEKQNPSLFHRLNGSRGLKRSQRRARKALRAIDKAPYGKISKAVGTWRGENLRAIKARVRGKARATKLNPTARDVFEEFRGREATKKIALKGHGTGTIAAGEAGKLIELKIKGRKKPLTNFNSQARLVFDAKKKLHIVGVQMARPNPPGEVDFGEVQYVVYRADKPKVQEMSGDDPGAVLDYKHNFGEDGGRRPHFIVDEEGLPFLEGGDYRISSEGVID